MPKARILWRLSLCLLVLSSVATQAQERELLFSKAPSPKLQEITAHLRNLKSAVTASNDLTRKTDYFVRITPRRYLFQGVKLNDSAMLGGNPFVFLTTPESVYGLSLLDIYVAIGYEAEDVLRWQRDEDMVMVVFKYPNDIATTDVTNGLLPDAWNKSVYIPSWENMFSLLHRMATLDPTTQQTLPTFRMSQMEREFLVSFPAEGKQKIKTRAYAGLKADDGPEWKYRSLLEQKLSVFEHFRGTGHTQNEVRDPGGVETGLLEAVGPNMNINQFPEVAIIHLGQLGVKDSYGAGCSLCKPPK